LETTIKPGEHKVFWADEDTLQGPLHLGFKLNAFSGDIGLSVNGLTFIDSVSYTQQDDNVSTGRYGDGSDTWRNFEVPTPDALITLHLYLLQFLYSPAELVNLMSILSPGTMKRMMKLSLGIFHSRIG